MKQITFLFIVPLVFLSFLSCRKVAGEGPVVSETRNESAFNGVSVSVDADVVYKQSQNFKIEIKAQQNIIDLIESRVVNGELRIRIKPNLRLRSHDRVIIYVSSPDIYSLTVDGSGRLDGVDSIVTSGMRLAVSGSGSININSLKSANDIETVISGSGDINVTKGTALQADVLVSGSGKVDMEGVIMSAATVHISGSGDTRIHATHTLDVRISGSGDVYYKGSPSISSRVSGSGKIIRL